MPKDDRVFVGHMLDLARSAARKVAGVTREEFDADENLRLARAHLIQTLGEAARRISEGFRSRNPLGLHRGDAQQGCSRFVDYDIVWDVATADLPALIPMLEGTGTT